ncbi:hypothetical protein M4D79_06855 [Mycolicibacterium novocastrense]|nr:hypothetical protein M4D79_06855 [Mycolicibacterium novocastrense]
MQNKITIITPVIISVVATAGLLTPGVATASPSVWGKTFAEASTELNNAGYTAVVATQLGDKLPQPECLVTSQRDASTPFASPNAKRQVYLSLNCYPEPASESSAGYSAANPNSEWLDNRNAAVQPRGEQ